jgi:hypothetical protein
MSLKPSPCVESCDDFELPTLEFDNCNPQIFESQIKNIYVTKPGLALNDWTDAAEWAARLSNSSIDANAIREFTVIGSLPLPDKTEKVISGERTVFVNKKRTLNFTIDELNDTNYEACRQMQCIKKAKVWFATVDGHLFGGNDGIDADLELDLELADGSGELEVVKGTLKWDSKYMPERITSPIAGE